MNVVDMQGIHWIRDGAVILQDIDWTVAPGQHWVLLGANGSGKSSLLNVLLGYQWPTKGSVQVLEWRYGRCDLQTVRTHIGWVNQAFGERVLASCPDDSAFEVVLSGRFASVGIYEEVTAEQKVEAQAFMEAFDCWHLAKHPYGTLSQGERQRVLIARAWMAKPALLVLDEPCTGLDVASRERLLRSLQALTTKSDNAPTILYVTHHVEEILPMFTNVLLLKDGQVLASGTKDEVLTDDVVSQAFDVDVEVIWRNDRPWLVVNNSDLGTA